MLDRGAGIDTKLNMIHKLQVFPNINTHFIAKRNWGCHISAIELTENWNIFLKLLKTSGWIAKSIDFRGLWSSLNAQLTEIKQDVITAIIVFFLNASKHSQSIIDWKLDAMVFDSEVCQLFLSFFFYFFCGLYNK